MIEVEPRQIGALVRSRKDRPKFNISLGEKSEDKDSAGPLMAREYNPVSSGQRFESPVRLSRHNGTQIPFSARQDASHEIEFNDRVGILNSEINHRGIRIRECDGLQVTPEIPLGPIALGLCSVPLEAVHAPLITDDDQEFETGMPNHPARFNSNL